MDKNNVTSLNKIEKQILHELRNKFQTAQSRRELENSFSHSLCTFLTKTCPDSITIHDKDISFSPAAKSHFTLSTDLIESETFMRTWVSSNLSGFVGKAADSAYHRFIHLEKHTEKTRSKIRN
jgi:hypothetical protein